MGAEFEQRGLSGEVDGANFGGYVKPESVKTERRDLRFKRNRAGKRRIVVIMRERGGKSCPFAAKTEGQSVPTIRQRVTLGTTVHADEASSWDELHASYDTRRVDHSLHLVDEDACTNRAENYFSRPRRAEIGTHHHVSGRYLHSYANEMSWRAGYRRVSNGE